jgi:hypothetical protein
MSREGSRGKVKHRKANKPVESIDWDSLVTPAQTNILLFSAPCEILHLLALSTTPILCDESIWKELYHRDCPDTAKVKLLPPATWRDVYFKRAQGRALPFELWCVGRSDQDISEVEEHRAEQMPDWIWNLISPQTKMTRHSASLRSCLFAQALRLLYCENDGCGLRGEMAAEWLFGARSRTLWVPYRPDEVEATAAFLEEVFNNSRTASNEAELIAMASTTCSSLMKSVFDHVHDGMSQDVSYAAVPDLMNAMDALLLFGADPNMTLERGMAGYDGTKTTMLHAIPCLFLDTLNHYAPYARGRARKRLAEGKYVISDASDLDSTAVFELMEVLVRHGADPNLVDGWGYTPLSLAEQIRDTQENKDTFNELWVPSGAGAGADDSDDDDDGDGTGADDGEGTGTDDGACAGAGGAGAGAGSEPPKEEPKQLTTADAQEDWLRKWQYLMQEMGGGDGGESD